MADLLFGKALNWTCWDDRNLLTTRLHSLLNEWASDRSVKVRLTRLEKLEYYAQLRSQQIGLAAWALWEETLLESLCQTLAVIQAHSPAPICICYVVPELAEHVAILTEAGAQIVVSQLPSLESALSKALASVHLSNHGFHPLTGGLVERLPWADKDIC